MLGDALLRLTTAAEAALDRDPAALPPGWIDEVNRYANALLRKPRPDQAELRRLGGRIGGVLLSLISAPRGSEALARHRLAELRRHAEAVRAAEDPEALRIPEPANRNILVQRLTWPLKIGR
ncbi:hypothetical protein [Teichococcus cervicalis]|uniref:Uncharacterized protein n=1 Tax=Pseudoroseomonas cervicalis ATCC 49957 TaxID=525371 RepID=D5RTH9_9PROT|nr:hypothetical protein [Pseudoroseomonas cervicalis]EFH09410.1 hypothetical protein HMPREF0731_4391 [Pseudoroseomonas cervicalis ATCC 49957]